MRLYLSFLCDKYKKNDDIYYNFITNTMANSHVKLLKKSNDLICFTHKENGVHLFVKIFYINNEKILNEFNREIHINKYISTNIKSLKYYTKVMNICENIIPEYNYDFIHKKKCNIITYEHSGENTLKYYINKLSPKNFQNILEQLREATELLEEIDVIHYDLYCETNIMLKKINNEWIIKIVDYGLSYIDETEKSKFDYNTAIESIKHFNKKHII